MQETIGIIMLLTLAFGIVLLMWRSGPDGIRETLMTIAITAMAVGWVVIALKLIFGERT